MKSKLLEVPDVRGLAEKDEVKVGRQRNCGDGLNLDIALVEGWTLDDGKQVHVQRATPITGGETPQEVSDASIMFRIVKIRKLNRKAKALRSL